MKVLVFKDIKNKRWTIWSINEETGLRGKHLFHADELFLRNANFIVLEDKRKNILKSKKRFPHAWVIGEIDKKIKKAKNQKEITYNPFKDKSFKSQNKAVKSRKLIKFENDGKLYSATA